MPPGRRGSLSDNTPPRLRGEDSGAPASRGQTPASRPQGNPPRRIAPPLSRRNQGVEGAEVRWSGRRSPPGRGGRWNAPAAARHEFVLLGSLAGAGWVAEPSLVPQRVDGI